MRPRSRLFSTICLSLFSAIVLCLSGPGLARAQELGGSLGGGPLLSVDGDLGAAAMVDLWAPIGPLRLGGFLGGGAIISDQDQLNRVLMPFGATVALEFIGEYVGGSLRLRGGAWAGATQEEKLSAGAFVAGGLHFYVNLGHGARLQLGLDLWGVEGAGETVLFSPTLGLTWSSDGLGAGPD